MLSWLEGDDSKLRIEDTVGDGAIAAQRTETHLQLLWLLERGGR